MPSDRGLTDALADFAAGTKYADLGPEVVQATKQVILDTVGCTVAGLNTDIGRCLAKLKADQGGRAEATVFAVKMRLPCSSVAYVHAQAANALDADETLLYRAHFANCIVLPVLAMAERTGSSGEDIIAATAVGFDVAARVILSFPYYDTSRPDEVRPTPVTSFGQAVFGTVAAVGKLLGLSRDQFARAFGIACQSTPLQREPRGTLRATPEAGGRMQLTMTKYAMYGTIAEAGMNAAMLTSFGFTGPDRLFDDDGEFWRSFGAVTFDGALLARDLGRRWFITETSFKPYPFGRQANIAVDLFDRIVRDERLAADDIEEIVVRVAPTMRVRNLAQNAGPRAPQEFSFSLPYVFAMVAAGIPPGPKWHRPENHRNPEHQKFMGKVRVEVNPEWRGVLVEQVKAEGTYRRIPHELTVRAKGRTFTAYADTAKGDPWTPETKSTDEDLQRKFREFTSDSLSQERIEQAIQEVSRLERAPSVHALMAALA